MDFDAILFDLGGVLIDIDYHKTITAFESLGMADFKSAYSQADQGQLFDDFETGQISAQRFINQLLPHLYRNTTPNQVAHAWNAMILGVPMEKITLLSGLKKTFPLYLLSNTNELHIPVVRREWAKVSPEPMEFFFDEVFLSHEIGMRKPAQETFRFVCEKINIHPSRLFFVDDSIQHINGALEAGLQAFHLKESLELYQIFS